MSAPWFCPRCGLKAARIATDTVCTSCGLAFGTLVYHLLEFNPHLPPPIAPTDVRLNLELHDSSLVSVDPNGFKIDAYVHRWVLRERAWSGSGWIQRFRVDLRSTGPTKPVILPQAIADGTLVVGDTVHDGLIPYPLPRLGSARVLLELGAEAIEIQGDLVAIRAVNEARFVEVLPPDFAPEPTAG